MLWLIYAIMTALFWAITDVFAKKLAKTSDEYFIAWSKWIFAIPTVLIFLILTSASIGLAGGVYVWIALAVLFCLEGVALLCYMKAIKRGNLVSTMPFLSFTPVFLIITAFIFIGEVPSVFGIIGILMIVPGTYILNIKHLKNGFLEPFKAIRKDAAALYMLAVALLWALQIP